MGSEPEAEYGLRAPLPSFSWPGWQQATIGQEPARATAGWATEGTQSEDMAEVHLQTLRPHCGRRETTAAHISGAWASPGQEAELAVTGVAERRGEEEGRVVQISPTESLSQWQGRLLNLWGPG